MNKFMIILLMLTVGLFVIDRKNSYDAYEYKRSQILPD
jgi:hypothetical protein